MAKIRGEKFEVAEDSARRERFLMRHLQKRVQQIQLVEHLHC